MALVYIGPIIAAFGSDEQKARWLPPILASQEMWAQGYSEPEAGSDLANLSCRADWDGDDYVLNGTKTWTTRAQWADWIFCLARTSREARRQDGISLICVPMTAPGITVSPIISIDGTHELNEVRFDNVRTPASNRIGDEGKAWHYANVLLANERLSYAHIGQKQALLAAITARAANSPAAGPGSMLHDAYFARRLALAQIGVDTLEISLLRVLTGEVSRAAVSTLKITSTQLTQQIDELAIELGGRHALPFPDRSKEGWEDVFDPQWQFAPATMGAYLLDRAQTIYGGATEVQKNAGLARAGSSRPQ